MTEQERTYLDEGTIAYLRLVEEIVRENFDALDTSDSEAEGGEGSYRDATENDLKRLDLEELERDLLQTQRLLDGFHRTAEAVNPVAQMALVEAQERTEAALERVQAHRATWG